LRPTRYGPYGRSLRSVSTTPNLVFLYLFFFFLFDVGRGQHIDTFVSDSTCALNILGLQPASVIENSNSIVPAATIALGLMYLRTNDVDAAAAFQLGKYNKTFPMCKSKLIQALTISLHEFAGIDDEICPPQHLTLKIMMRALILWDEIAPTEDWVWNCIPRNLAVRKEDSLCMHCQCYKLS